MLRTMCKSKIRGAVITTTMLHYEGSIPAHICYDLDVWGDQELEQYIAFDWLVSTDGDEYAPGSWTEVLDFKDIQLHECYWLKLNVYLCPTLLQANGAAAQGLTGGFDMELMAHQWNEDPCPTD